MSLERKAIRQNVVDLLKNHTSVGDRVFNSRDLDLPDENVPTILVYTREDSVNTEKTKEFHKSGRFRDLELVIEVIVFKGMTNYADAIDDLSEEINGILWQADALCLLHDSINEINLSGESMSFESEGSRTLGINTISYEIEYLQGIRLETASLDELKRIHGDQQKIKSEVEFYC